MKSVKSAPVVALFLALASCPATNLPAMQQAEAACCYFAARDKDINQPGQKAFITWNPVTKTEAFTVQPKFEGNALDFGMVIPTPSRPKLDEMPRDFFKDLAIFTILMPLPEPIYGPNDPHAAPMPAMAEGGTAGALPVRQKRATVRVLEAGVVGSLDYKIIVAEDAKGLFDWLKVNKYSYAGDEATLDFYIRKKSFFTVMKIDPKQMKKGAGGTYTGEVTPTRFTFSANQCAYPLKITQISVKDKTDALFYVQAPAQMDMPDEWSWMHSYRPMYLTYMLGCGVSPLEQQELQARAKWLEARNRQDAGFETTKLEWAKQLGQAEMSVLDDPLKNYGQMGVGDLPPGAKVIALGDFIERMKTEHMKANKQMPSYAKQELARMEDNYQPAKGMIVQYDPKTVGRGYFWTRYAFYANRQAPADEVKGLTRLKGHLQNGQWLTKFRRQMRASEMTRDIVFAEVPKSQQQTYVRIMPTSPP